MSMYPDEQTVEIDGETVSYPGLIGGKFSSGDFSDPSKKPSCIPAETINLILDNIAALITAAGGVPANIGADQLVSALASVATAKKVVQRDAAGRAQFTDPVVAADVATKKYVDAQILERAEPIGSIYFQGPHDDPPATVYLGTTWEDVSAEEANLTRRCVGSLSGAFFGGTPAVLSVSVASGVPTISIVSGGSGYTSDGGSSSGTRALIIAGACTTQMVANATVTNGVLTAINVLTAGAGYTSGSVAVYDSVASHGDIAQRHQHIIYTNGNNGFSPGSTSLPLTSLASNSTRSADFSPSPVASGYGDIRCGPENSTAWIVTKKWRRKA